jgi:hypoxanthine phosphoribosyltransferase
VCFQIWGEIVPPHYQEILDYVLIEADRLQSRIDELGVEITAYYQTKPGLMMVGILKGSTLFLTDLMRKVDLPHTIDFMDVSSYGAGVRASDGDVRILMDLHTPIENRHVLIVEDIIDSGNTINKVMRLLSARGPASLQICTLLDKSERRVVKVPIAFRGFEIPNVFVFGYGLDIDEYYRNLPFIGVVKPGVVIAEDNGH